METNQPKWKCIAQLGDVNPLDYGGYFILEDETGVYPAEGERIFAEENRDTWNAYRFTLDRLQLVRAKSTDGKEEYDVLIPANYDKSWPHHISGYDEWFHKDIGSVSSFCGIPVEDLRKMFCSEDARERARAYEAVGEYFGFESLDDYPLIFTDRAEVEERYARGQYQI